MSARSRLLAVLLGLVLPTLGLAAWSTNAPQTHDASRMLPKLPKKLGPWVYQAEHRLDPGEFDALQPDEYLMHRYEAPGRSPIWIYVAIYGGRSSYGRGAHDPQVCYPAQGWDILGSHGAEIALAQGESLNARLLDTRNGLREESVLFWFQPRGRWPARESAEHWIRVVDAIRGRPEYAFVRLSAPSGRRDAAEHLLDFAERIAWPIRSALDHGESPVDSMEEGSEG